MAVDAAKQYEDEVNRISLNFLLSYQDEVNRKYNDNFIFQPSFLFMEVEAWKQEYEKVLEPVAKTCVDPEKEKLKKFKCEMCDFRAMTALGVKKHLNKQHPWKERGIDD